MTIYIKRCLLVTASQQKFAQDLCEALAGDAGKGMFTSGVSASGSLPATHFINEGMVEDTFAGALSDPSYLYGASQQGAQDLSKSEATRAFLGTVTLAQCQELLTSSDVSTDAPFGALARMGLKLLAAPLM